MPVTFYKPVCAPPRRVEPFHFSARYVGEEERMLDEVVAAFADRYSEGAGS